MAQNDVEINFIGDIKGLLSDLSKIKSEIASLQAQMSSTSSTNPFSGASQGASNARRSFIDVNRTLSDGSAIFQAIGDDASDYKAEIERLQKVLKDLQKAQASFQNAVDYDEIATDIRTVEARLNDLRRAYGRVDDVSRDSMRSVDGQINRLRGGVFGLSAGFRSLGSIIATAFAGIGLIEFARKVFEARANMESFSISLQTMVRSSQVANDLQRNLVAQASRTPFTLKEIQEQSVKLLAYGIHASEVTKHIETLGNISAGVGKEKLPQLTLAFGQVRAVGRLMGTELRQFTEAGVPLLEELANVSGLSVSRMQHEVNKGEVSFDMVLKALESMSAEGGRFFNLMESQSRSLAGQWSNLQDQVYQSLNTIGAGFDGTAKGLIGFLRDFVSAVAGSESALQRTVKVVKSAILLYITYKASLYAVLVAKRQMAFASAQLAVAEGTATIAQTALANSNRLLFTTMGATVVMTNGLTASFRALWLTISANPIGFILSGLSLLASAYYAVGAVTDDVTDSTQENINKLKAEQEILPILISQIRQTTEGSAERLYMIEKIKEAYPDLLAGIKGEIRENETLDKILKEVNGSYSSRIYLAEQAYRKEKVYSNLRKDIDEEQVLINELKSEDKRLEGVNDLASIRAILMGNRKFKKVSIPDGIGGFREYTTSGDGRVDDAVRKIDIAITKSQKNKTTYEKELIDADDKILAEQSKQQKIREENHKVDVAFLEKYKNLTAKQINAIKDQKERSEIQLAQRREFQYKALTPKEVGTPEESDYEKRLRLNKLQKAGEKSDKEDDAYARELAELERRRRDFLVKMNELELNADDVRLSNLDKTSEEYLIKKKAYDAGLIEQEKIKLKELFNLQAGATVNYLVGNDRRSMNVSFEQMKIIEFMRKNNPKLDADNALEQATDEARQYAKSALDLEFENSEKTLSIRNYLNEKLVESDRKTNKEIFDAKIKQRQLEAGFITDETDKRIIQLTIRFDEEMKLYEKFPKIQEKLTEQFVLDEYNIRTNGQRERIELLEDGFSKEEKLLDLKYEQDFKNLKLSEDEKNALISKYQKERSQLLVNETLSNRDNRINKLDSQEEVADATIGTRRNEFGSLEIIPREEFESIVDYEARMERLRLENQLKFAKQRVEIEKQTMIALMQLSVLGNKSLTSEQYENQKNIIAIAEATVTKLKNSLDANPLADPSKWYNKDIFEHLKISFSNNQDINEKAKDAFKDIVKSIAESANQILSIEEKNTEDRIRNIETLLDKRQSQLDEEKEKQRQGLANSVDTKTEEIDKLREAREDELEHLKKIQKQKLIVETAMIASQQIQSAVQMIGAVANIFGSFSKIPFGVGIPLGIAVAGSMYASYKGIKAKFSEINQTPRLRKGRYLAEGSTHEEQGMDVVDVKSGRTLYNIEKGEFLIGTEPTKRYRELIETINSDTFSLLTPNKQRSLLLPLGLKSIDSSQRFASTTYNNKNTFDRVVEKAMYQQSYDPIVRNSLDEIAKNTQRLPKKQRTHMGNGVFIIEENGKTTIEKDLNFEKYGKL